MPKTAGATIELFVLDGVPDVARGYARDLRPRALDEQLANFTGSPPKGLRLMSIPKGYAK